MGGWPSDCQSYDCQSQDCLTVKAVKASVIVSNHSSDPTPPLHKGEVSFLKIDGNGGGLKIFARKGGGGQNGGGGCLEMGGCHIILRFFRRFLMMQH